mmetsp:Transcript_12822/g.39904  ORF Transcript_12822/g.39904 Transcript_12822/m.39904 type:complete len:270 (-) Transcript_12822:386-1195(-)
MPQPERRRLNQLIGLQAGLHAEHLLGQIHKHARHVALATLVPERVRRQPVAQVARLLAGHPAQQLGPDLEEAQVASELVLLAAAAKLGEDRLDGRGRAGFGPVRLGLHLERAHPVERHELIGRFEDKPHGHALSALTQPFHLVKVENQRREEAVGARKRRFDLSGALRQITVGERQHLQRGAALLQVGRHLRVKPLVVRLKASHEHHRRRCARSRPRGGDGVLLTALARCRRRRLGLGHRAERAQGHRRRVRHLPRVALRCLTRGQRQP